ncbi:transposase [Neisseria meningitidis]|nr:transposase [Neisseria meningitidis]CWM50722.1 transposase [Neisseria meningitidis]CWM67327.1 transposase [Neisseria meningitidis]CWM76677.1 transposase [Neisseria meningitidis]CWN40698.1 transposase [Neisseria meningitidis]
MERKQPKTCVWVSAVGRERNFAKVSISIVDEQKSGQGDEAADSTNSTEPIHSVLQHLRESFSLS